MKKKVNKSPKPKSKADNYWQLFEKNGSVGAFIMFHRSRVEARAEARQKQSSKS